MAIKRWCLNYNWNKIQFLILLFFLFITKTKNYSVNKFWNDSFMSTTTNCALELKPQKDLDLDKMMGKWYVIEVMEHKRISLDISDIGVTVVINVCPVVDIRFDEKGLLRLVWSEEYGNLEYTFHVSSLDSKSHGYWNSVYQQNGSIVDNNKYYNQFNGTVIVTKAVAQHILLTFCPINFHNSDGDSNPNQQQNQVRYFSILLGRFHRLDKDSITGIHKLLNRRGIGISSIKSTCRFNNASITICRNYFNYLIFLLLLYVYSNKVVSC